MPTILPHCSPPSPFLWSRSPSRGDCQLAKGVSPPAQDRLIYLTVWPALAHELGPQEHSQEGIAAQQAEPGQGGWLFLVQQMQTAKNRSRSSCPRDYKSCNTLQPICDKPKNDHFAFKNSTTWEPQHLAHGQADLRFSSSASLMGV